MTTILFYLFLHLFKGWYLPIVDGVSKLDRSQVRVQHLGMKESVPYAVIIGTRNIVGLLHP
jgi:hypothetical protein